MEPSVGQQVADQLVDEVMLRLSRVGALLPGLVRVPQASL